MLWWWISARIYHTGVSHNSASALTSTYTLLERRNFFIRKCVGLGNNRNEVDFGVESAHDLDIQWFKRVSCGLDEVDTCMHTVVNDVHAVDFILGIQVGVKSLLDVLNNWSPGVIVVDEVTKARGINHR